MKLILIVILATAAIAAQAQKITVKGSDTLVILGQRWAATYTKTHPGATLQVTGGGSGTGFAALLNGSTDICNASREMKLGEIAEFIKKFKVRPHEYKVAFDALSVYVNNDNPVNKLSIPQLEKIFTGKITNWKQVGGPDLAISLYGRENSSGSYEFFKDHVLNGKDFAAATKTMPGTAAIIHGVAHDKGGVGYGGIAYGKGVKHLKISKTNNSDAIEPKEATVYDRTYPLLRYLYNYVSAAKDTGAVAAYIAWCISDAGQAVVHDVGYVPLSKNMR
jgi:phosphate transport system substrate-binding protein